MKAIQICRHGAVKHVEKITFSGDFHSKEDAQTSISLTLPRGRTFYSTAPAILRMFSIATVYLGWNEQTSMKFHRLYSKIQKLQIEISERSDYATN